MNKKLLNKLHFLSLFSLGFVCIFVSYSYTINRIFFFMRYINDIIKPGISTIRFTLIGLGLLLSLFANAQGWERYYGEDGDEDAAAVIETIDHGYAVVGRKATSSNGFEVYVLRVDVDGTVLWENTYGTIADEFGYDIVQTSDGGFVVVGETNLGGSFGGRDVYLFKIDEKGNQEWQNFFGLVATLYMW